MGKRERERGGERERERERERKKVGVGETEKDQTRFKQIMHKLILVRGWKPHGGVVRVLCTYVCLDEFPPGRYPGVVRPSFTGRGEATLTGLSDRGMWQKAQLLIVCY